MLTIAIPAAHAYGADEPLPYIEPAAEVLNAAYTLAHSHPGGIQALAIRMVVSPNTLTHKVNPQNTTHHLTLREAVDMQVASGSAAILHAMADALGYVVHRATPDQADGNAVQALVHAQSQWGDFIRAAGEPVARVSEEAGAVTGNELRRVEYHAQEVHASMGNVLATLRRLLRAAPGAAA